MAAIFLRLNVLRVNDNGAKRFALMFITHNVPAIWYPSSVNEGIVNTVPHTGKSTLLVLKLEYSRQTGSRPWLLMPWPLMLLVHQQPWYWLCVTFLCCTGKKFNYLCHFSIKEWYKMLIKFSWNKFTWQLSMLFQFIVFCCYWWSPYLGCRQWHLHECVEVGGEPARVADPQPDPAARHGRARGPALCLLVI